MRKDEPPCSSFSQQKLCGHSLQSHSSMQQHFILNQPEGGAKFKVASRTCMVILNQNFCLNISACFILALGFYPTSAWLSDSSSSKKGANTAVCLNFWMCVKIFVFPMDVEVNIQQGRELCVVCYWQLQLMLFFTLWKVTEWSLVTKKFSGISSRIHGD